MLLGSIQIFSAKLGNRDARDISSSVATNSVRLLSLRGCQMSDHNFNTIISSIGDARALLQVNLNMGVVNGDERAAMLAGAIGINRSLTGIFLHESNFGKEGIDPLLRSIIMHPRITCVDLGDCQLTNAAVAPISVLLRGDGARPGVEQLTLSSNKEISSYGWTLVFMALREARQLRALHLDYNNIGVTAAACLAVAAVGHPTLFELDLEATEINDTVGKLFIHLLKHHESSLRKLSLDGNSITSDIIDMLGELCRDYQTDDDLSTTESQVSTAHCTGKPSHMDLEKAKITRDKCRDLGNDNNDDTYEYDDDNDDGIHDSWSGRDLSGMSDNTSEELESGSAMKKYSTSRYDTVPSQRGGTILKQPPREILASHSIPSTLVPVESSVDNQNIY